MFRAVSWQDLKNLSNEDRIAFLRQNASANSIEEAIRFLAGMYYCAKESKEGFPVSPVSCQLMAVFTNALRSLGGRTLPQHIDDFVSRYSIRGGESFTFSSGAVVEWQRRLQEVPTDEPTVVSVTSATPRLISEEKGVQPRNDKAVVRPSATVSGARSVVTASVVAAPDTIGLEERPESGRHRGGRR